MAIRCWRRCSMRASSSISSPSKSSKLQRQVRILETQRQQISVDDQATNYVLKGVNANEMKQTISYRLWTSTKTRRSNLQVSFSICPKVLRTQLSFDSSVPTFTHTSSSEDSWSTFMPSERLPLNLSSSLPRRLLSRSRDIERRYCRSRPYRSLSPDL